MPRVGAAIVPFWQTVDRATVRLYHGDVIDVLKRLPSKSVHCVVTPPPYWGLRDYGIAGQLGSEALPDCLSWARGENCAERDWAAACPVCRITLVFREVRRVLRDDGTLWLNYGDSYAGSGKGRNADGTHGDKGGAKQHTNKGAVEGVIRKPRPGAGKVAGRGASHPGTPPCDLPGGNLIGVPWRVALALQADGWVLRQDIIWAKPSPMPESVRNHCTKAHEYVFLLTKRMNYFYDAEAIKEDAVQAGRTRADKAGGNKGDAVNHSPGSVFEGSGKSNKRSVWTVSSPGYPGAHFATFPISLIQPMIKAGTSEHGCCADCGSPWVRVTENAKLFRERPNEYVKRTGEAGTGNSCSNAVAGGEVRTVGWRPNCECHGKLVERRIIGSRANAKSMPGYSGSNSKAMVEYVSDLPLSDHPVKPCTVMDVFVGSGTTCVAAMEHGRYSDGWRPRR